MATTSEEHLKETVMNINDVGQGGYDHATKDWLDVDHIAELMRLIMEVVANSADEGLSEKLRQAFAKSSPSLRETINAVCSRKQRDVSVITSSDGHVRECGDSLGGAFQDGEGHRHSESGVRVDHEAHTSGAPKSKGKRNIAMDTDKILIPKEDQSRPKRSVTEEYGDGLPPGKRPSPPSDRNEITNSSVHTAACVKPEVPKITEDNSDAVTLISNCVISSSNIVPSIQSPLNGMTSIGSILNSVTSKGSTLNHITSNESSLDNVTFKGVTSHDVRCEGLTSDSLPSSQTHLTRDGQPHAVWKVDRLSMGLADETDGPAVSMWRLQGYQLNYHLNGEGTVIAIIDSGINLEHVAFSRQRILWARSFVPGDSVTDIIGHGTRCAGIACGAPFEGTMGTEAWVGGVAPGARLAVCKVVPDGSTEADLNAVCEALDFIQNYNCVHPREPVNVVSLSFGTPYYSRLICSRIHALAGTGVIVVCAASNDGRLTPQPISFPARLGQVLCIGSHGNTGKPSPFSAVGREIDFLAPGEDVWAPCQGGPYATSCGSGTSYSAPAVAGLVGLVLQYLKFLSSEMDAPLFEYAHSVWVMRDILKEMATSPGHHSEELGYGCLRPEMFFEKHCQEVKRIILKMIQWQ